MPSMADVDRQLPLRIAEPKPSPDPTPTVVGLIHDVLTTPTMLLSALALLNALILLAAVMVGELRVVAVAAPANMTLCVWAVIRYWTSRRARKSSGANGSEFDPKTLK